MKKILFSAVLLCVANTAWAILPPFYQSIAEYGQLLKDPQLEKALGSGQVIEGIDRTSTGFVVRGNRSEVQVQIVYEPQNRPGPARFHFVFNAPGSSAIH